MELDSQVLHRIIAIQTEIGASSWDLGQVMDLVVERLLPIARTEGAAIELLEGDEMVYRAASGLAAGRVGLRLARHGSFSGLCVEMQRPLVCQDSEADDRVDRQACRKVGLRSMLVYPLNHAGETVGVLKVMSALPNAIGDFQTAVVSHFADIIAGRMAAAGEIAMLRRQIADLHRMVSQDGKKPGKP